MQNPTCLSSLKVDVGVVSSSSSLMNPDWPFQFFGHPECRWFRFIDYLFRMCVACYKRKEKSQVHNWNWHLNIKYLLNSSPLLATFSSHLSAICFYKIPVDVRRLLTSRLSYFISFSLWNTADHKIKWAKMSQSWWSDIFNMRNIL